MGWLQVKDNAEGAWAYIVERRIEVQKGEKNGRGGEWGKWAKADG